MMGKKAVGVKYSPERSFKNVKVAARNKHSKHKFQQLVIQTLLQKDEEESADSDENQKDFEMPEEVGVNLNLSRKNLKEFPAEFLDKMTHVQYLYLEGNHLTVLPKNFFKDLRFLKWLDLRNNSLLALPTVGLRNHPSLEVILLQGNRIRNLPLELATVPFLKGLQTTGNPITNVPYDVIAEGFQEVMFHLKKLLSQDEILLPASDSIIVKPSTSRDDTPELQVEPQEPTEEAVKMWDLDKLTQWRQFMKRKSKIKIENPVSQQPKISVSVRSHPKVPFRQIPFRCGVYNKNRHRITTSALHFRKLRNSRLGYKRKPITMAMVEEKAREENSKLQMREILEKRAKKIQRMRDKEVLKSWRDHFRLTREQLKLLDNYQQYPTRNFADKTPFDTDPEFLNMLNRADLYRSLKDYENRSKRSRKNTARITALDLEKQMAEIMAMLQKLDTNDGEDIASPAAKQSHVCSKMSRILDIQKTLRNLQTLNSSMSGIMPLMKPKSIK